MVKPLSFKGERAKPRPKRKREEVKEANEEEEGWTEADMLEDVTGPVVLISKEKVALAAREEGSVYSTVINAAPDAEPTSVEQVWIAARIAAGNKVSFKSSSGSYLSCSKLGTLSAAKVAISKEEEFSLVWADMGWTLQTAWDGYISLQQGMQPRGDTAIISSPADAFTILVQKRLKKKAAFATTFPTKLSSMQIQDLYVETQHLLT